MQAATPNDTFDSTNTSSDKVIDEDMEETMHIIAHASTHNGNTFLSAIASATRDIPGNPKSSNSTSPTNDRNVDNLYREKHFNSETIKNEATTFLKIAREVIEKHFKNWTHDLLYYMVGSEREPVQKFCCWLLNMDHKNLKKYHSSVHKQEIDLDDFFRYLFPLELRERNEQIRQNIKTKFNDYENTFRKIAMGEYLWESSDDDVIKLRRWFENYVVPHGHHTHLVEAFVREASLCAATNRDETLRSLFAICRSFLHYDLNTDIREAEQDRIRKGNRFRAEGVQGS